MISISQHTTHTTLDVYALFGRRSNSPFNYHGSSLIYQAEEVQACIHAKLTESPIMPLTASINALNTMDTIRRLVGVRYDADNTYISPVVA
jgi:hypothetical protein